jgi:hypothetical protein
VLLVGADPVVEVIFTLVVSFKDAARVSYRLLHRKPAALSAAPGTIRLVPKRDPPATAPPALAPAAGRRTRPEQVTTEPAALTHPAPTKPV